MRATAQYPLDFPPFGLSNEAEVASRGIIRFSFVPYARLKCMERLIVSNIFQIIQQTL